MSLFGRHLKVFPSAPCGHWRKEPQVGANNKNRRDSTKYAVGKKNIVHAILLCATLTGCATTPTADKPIPVSCVKEAPEKPLTKPEAEILAMNDYSATLTVWTERLLLKSYAERAEAVINACR